MFKFLSRYNFLNNLKTEKQKFKKYYDTVIIGGGSGGLSFAKNYKNNEDIAIFDYVIPTDFNNKWGIGGTCVNVGCIPKKLYHIASINNQYTNSMNNYGININKYDNKIDLSILQKNVKNHIKSLNFGYKKLISKNNIDYINKFATFKDRNKILYGEYNDINNFILNNKINNLEEINFENAIISVGTRPKKLTEQELPGSKYCITSDDIFFIKKVPTKCLIIGAGYIGWECASFLNGFGSDVTVLARSRCLSAFDNNISDYLFNSFQKKGINIKLKSQPIKIDKINDNSYTVEYKYNNNIYNDNYDLIIMATKREANLELLNIKNSFNKIKINNNKIIGNFDNTINSKVENNLFAIGDVLDGYEELTPLAIKMGKNLANYLQSFKYNNINNENIPTTIFTDPEYSVIGLSEEKAEKKYGKENIIIYHGLFENFDYILNEESSEVYFKIICLKENEKLIGIHIVGKNSGEIIQGLSIAFNKGITKSDLDNNIGIHPTNAEGIVYLNKVKVDNMEIKLEGCWS